MSTIRKPLLISPVPTLLREAPLLGSQSPQDPKGPHHSRPSCPLASEGEWASPVTGRVGESAQGRNFTS